MATRIAAATSRTIAAGALFPNVVLPVDTAKLRADLNVAVKAAFTLVTEVSENGGATWSEMCRSVHPNTAWLDRQGVPTTRAGHSFALYGADGSAVALAAGAIARTRVVGGSSITAALDYVASTRDEISPLRVA